MDLVVIFCCLLLFSFDPAVATSLITGKLRAKQLNTKTHISQLNMHPSLVPSWPDLLPLFWGVRWVTSQRICLKPEVGNTLFSRKASTTVSATEKLESNGYGSGWRFVTSSPNMIAGQRVCKAGKGKPCYKLAYFSELRRRLNFMEADLACRRDGGQLLSIESESEQKVVEQLITELRPADGDFWIGLRRNHGNEESSSDCSPQYYWADGSKSTFR